MEPRKSWTDGSQKRLFVDGSRVSERLIRPGLLTRFTDRVVSLFGNGHAVETPLVLARMADHRPVGKVALFFAACTLLFPFFGRLSETKLFFGTQALMVIGLRTWDEWHEAHPPEKDADSTLRGVSRAAGHAAMAFCAFLFFFYAMKRSVGFGADYDLMALWGASGAAVLMYQRRTGWKHDDPERGIVVATVAIVFAAIVTGVKFLLR